MRKVALVLLLVVTSLPARAAARRFESRSDRHALNVEVDDTSYRVNVVDVASGNVMLSAGFPINSKDPMDAMSKLPRGEVRVMLRTLNPPAIAVVVDIFENGKVVDSFSSAWATAPRPRTQSISADPTSPLSSLYPDVKRLGDGNNIKPPVVIKRVEPFYSPEARQAHVSGIVIVETLVDRNGDVKDAAIIKDLPYNLGAAAVEAVKQWKFQPATLDGQPVDVLFNLTVNFKLDSAAANR